MPDASRPPRYPALAEWRRQLAAGERTPVDFDALWRAACCEQWALDFGQWGLPEIASSFHRDAVEIIRREATRQRQAEGRRSA